LLDHGTLYVARFDDAVDGKSKGRWIALEHGKNGLTADVGLNQFRQPNLHFLNA
jgi:uncharacterized protein